MIEQGDAAAIMAAEANQETDSVLSSSSSEMNENFIQRKASRESQQQQQPRLLKELRMSSKTYHFVQNASIELEGPFSMLDGQPNATTLSRDTSTDAAENKDLVKQKKEGGSGGEEENNFDDNNKQSWEDGVLVETEFAESTAAENPCSAQYAASFEMGCSERGKFSDFQQEDTAPFEERQPQHHRSSLLSDAACMDQLLHDDFSIDSSPSLVGATLSATGTTVPASTVEDMLLSAGIISDIDCVQLDQFRRDKGIKDAFSENNNHDYTISILYHIFSNFSTPCVTWDSVKCVFLREHDAAYYYTSKTIESVALPMDSVVNVEENSLVLSILQCRNHQHLLELPKPFLLAFFRILIRLLSSESDVEYNEKSLLRCHWKDNPNLLDDHSDPYMRLRNAASVIDKDPKSLSVTGSNLGMSDNVDRDYSTRKNSRIYSMVRLQQSGTTAGTSQAGDRNYTARKLLRIFDAIKAQKAYRELLAPIARLLGLICTAGVSERVLRRMLTLASSPIATSAQVPPVARLLLVRAIKEATDGASRSIFFTGKTSLNHFFSFGGGKGLSRTISGLSSWPFRNDFGMAVWFRAETFDNRDLKYPVLLSVRAEDGGGVEISLMPLRDSSSNDLAASSAAALVISIFDSDPTGQESVEVQRLRIPGCVVLPRMWYHVAIRHTRSRMKGVFSLSTRQQVSVMLDGKIMLTEALAFPKISDDDFHSENKAAAFLQKAVRRSISRTGLSLAVVLGGSFQGQTGSLSLFHENVSDATLRALYEVGAGTANTVVAKTDDHQHGWDSRRGDIVRKSQLLDVGIKQDDAEDIVVSQRRQSTGDLVLDWVSASNGALAVIDLGEGEDQEVFDLPEDLSKAAFSSKLFLVWDPSRTVANMALDLHIGAHVKMADGGVQSWQVEGAQDVIGSIGGVQALMPVFQSLLCGDIEKAWRSIESHQDLKSESNNEVSGTFTRECLWSVIPDLLSLVASFVQDHGENARELLRCGGVDVIENVILVSRKVALNTPSAEIFSLFGPLTAFPKLSKCLVESLTRLRSACSHYIGLETKVFARLLFNIPLWFSGVERKLHVSLDATLLPLLAVLAKASPDKVRDCIGIKDAVLLIKSFVDYEDERFGDSTNSVSDWRGPLSILERRHTSDVLLGIVFQVLASTTLARDLSPFLNFLSYCLDSEWDESSQEMGEKNQIKRKGNREERYRFAVKGCTVLLLLLQMKPQVPNFYESLAQSCGSAEGAAGWILCALVNSFDDTIRSLGMRCIVAFIDKTAKSLDESLTVGPAQSELEDARPAPVNAVRNNKRIQSILAVGKGLAGIGPGASAIALPSSQLTARVTYKLMWHLLKGHRTRFGKKSYDALVYLAVDEAGTLLSSLPSKEFVIDTFVTSDDILRGCYIINIDYRDPLSEIRPQTPGKSLRGGLGISTVMRLLRFLSSDMKDNLLADLLMLVREDISSVATLSGVPDWQPCLFHLMSETLERFNGGRTNGNDGLARSVDLLDTPRDQETVMPSEIVEAIPTVEKRLDLCLDLYATLLGHCVREGGDKVSVLWILCLLRT